MKDYKTFLKEASYFDISNVDKWIVPLSTKINAPVMNVSKSVLGGEENVTIMIKFSLDEKHKWKNGIWHNSRHANIRLDRDGTLEMFNYSPRSMGKGLRKTRVKNAKDAINKINDWVAKVGGADYEKDSLSKRTTKATE
ncbi:uncharacterized protein METZ01_LOCUS189541 [marine metagenome]|uniref:Uncharacterized protein n=1 Tax=marine metagenome TaxID=408172 RepID=A0A382DGD1_9ZZZZ